MSDDSFPLPLAPTVSSLDDRLAARFLLNAAEALRTTIIPELHGSAAARAGESAVIIARVAQRLYAADRDPVVVEGPEWQGMANAEGAALDAAEAEVQANEQVPAAAPAAERDFDRDGLERYLRAHDRGGASVRIVDYKQLAGGRSKQTVLVTQAGARNLPAELVLRQDWASAVTGTTVVTEFALLQEVSKAGLKVPQPLLLEPSADPLGAPFLLVTRVEGSTKGDLFNPLLSETLALQLAEQLGRLHSLPLAAFERHSVPTEAYSRDQLSAGLETLRQQHATLGLSSATIDIALDWLAANIDRVEGNRALVHNDLGCHNFLIEGESLSAILDWELAHISHPAADLGYIRSFVEKMIPWPRFVDAYRAAGGAVISAPTLDFYTLWTSVRLYCLLLQARAGVASGMVRDTEITYAVAHFLPQLVQRISKELRNILEADKTAK